MLFRSDSEAMARLLVERGADPMKTDDKGSTLLHYAVVKNDAPALIRYYIGLGVDPNQRGAHDSTPAAIVAMYFHETDDSSRTATAESVFRALVEGGADLDIQEASGQTLLMDATMRDDRTMTALLLKLGADRSIRDMNGKTAEDWAIELGNTDLAQLLNH